MFINLYRTYIKKIDSDLPDIESNRVLCVKDAEYLVNTKHIVYIETIEKHFLNDNRAFYRIQISGDPTTYYYISHKDYNKILGKEL